MEKKCKICERMGERLLNGIILCQSCDIEYCAIIFGIKPKFSAKNPNFAS